MWRLAFALMASPAWADSVVATRAIPAGAVVVAEDITLVAMDIPGAMGLLEDVIGQTTSLALAPGRAVLPDQLASQMRVDRNMIVPLILMSGGMEIRTEGRTLSEGKVGQTIEIMNMSSRARIAGRLQANGSVLVTATP